MNERATGDGRGLPIAGRGTPPVLRLREFLASGSTRALDPL